ncbi:hypothetical protein Tco_1499165 [Tanacetum coccineum]
MIGREFLGSFCVNYFEFELLKEENPSKKSRLGIFFSEEIFEGGVIRIHNAFVQDEALVLRPDLTMAYKCVLLCTVVGTDMVTECESKAISEMIPDW